jgi:methionyl-tRNA formyltransferase
MRGPAEALNVMKLMFAGTPEFAAHALDRLVNAGFEIALVLTQPDRPAGRGLRLLPSAVKVCAAAHNLPLAQPATLREPTIQARLREIGADVMIVAAYGLILPREVLNIPPHGCLNIHASLLPRWRGAAPIQRALLAGDRETGITIMQMDEGLDTGAILRQKKLTVDDDDTAQTLHDRLAELGAHMIVDALRQPATPHAQDSANATYAEKISKAEAAIDWRRSAVDICRQVRAFNPVPGAVTTWNGTPLKIWSATPITHRGGAPGDVVQVGADGIVVAASEGAVNITALQKAGAKRMNAAAFIGGATLVPGTRLGA